MKVSFVLLSIVVLAASDSVKEESFKTWDGIDSQNKYMYNNDAFHTTYDAKKEVYDNQRNQYTRDYKMPFEQKLMPMYYNPQPVQMAYNKQPTMQKSWTYNKLPMVPMTYNQQPMTYNQQPMIYNQQPMTYNQQPMIYNQQPMTYNQQPMAYNKQPMAYNKQPMAQMTQPQGKSFDYSNYEVIYDSKVHGLNHPFVVYDSKRDGKDSPLRHTYDNDETLETIFDTSVHGWDHPWVVYDSKRDGNVRKF